MKLLAIIIMTLPLSAFAQTEISGEVSGEWTAEDSPYIVVDSTWIPEDEELRIGPGVDVVFGERLGLEVFGTLTAEGTEDDSVRFLPLEEDKEWYCIHDHNQEAEINLNFCSIHGGRLGLSLTHGAVCRIADSKIIGNRVSIGLVESEIDIRRCYLSALTQGQSTIGNWCSRFTAIDCEIHGGRDEDGNYGQSIHTDCSGRSTLERSTVYGSMDNGTWYTEINFSDCEFFNGASLGYTGSIRNCIIHGNVRNGISRDYELIDNTIDGDHLSLIDFQGRMVRNTISVDRFNINGHPQDDIVITDCDIYTPDVRITEIGYLSIDNCIITGTVEVSVESYLDISKSVIFSNIILISQGMLAMYNNTIYVSNISSVRNYTAIQALGVYYFRNFNIKNNIVYIPECDEETRLFGFSYNDENIYPDVAYNCLYGYDSLIYRRYNRQDIVFNLDDTNIVSDPRFVSIDSLDFNLTVDSPCIDAGDPDGPLDPDRTRADIGAYYFSQSYILENFKGEHPSETILFPAFPNPFNSILNIEFFNPINEPLSFVLYDINGRELIRRDVQWYNTGRQSIVFECHSLPSGTYFVSLKSDKFVKYQKVELVR